MSEIKEKTRTALKGGEFIVKETNAQDIFIPEEWSEEQKMIAQMCKDFIKTEVFPNLDKLDSMSDPDMMPNLLGKAGELGLLGLSIPEDMGGLGVDFKTSMLATEALGTGHSFSVASIEVLKSTPKPPMSSGMDSPSNPSSPALPSKLGIISGSLMLSSLSRLGKTSVLIKSLHICAIIFCSSDHSSGMNIS
jgi:hypothetical protein